MELNQGSPVVRLQLYTVVHSYRYNTFKAPTSFGSSSVVGYEYDRTDQESESWLPKDGVLSNLCRATSGGYINFGCSREVLFIRGSFQW